MSVEHYKAHFFELITEFLNPSMNKNGGLTYEKEIRNAEPPLFNVRMSCVDDDRLRQEEFRRDHRGDVREESTSIRACQHATDWAWGF